MSEQFETVARWLDKLHYTEADGKTNNKMGDTPWVTLGDIVSHDSRVKSCIKCIDDMTDDLLEISDVLEEHQVNVKLENGRYLNPVSAIRSKVDVIWDEVQMIAAYNKRAERTCEMRADGAHCMNGVEFYECRSCGEYACIPTVMGKSEPPNYCPYCGAKVVGE